MPGNIDFIYPCSCNVVDLCYSINYNVIKETSKIFCRKRLKTQTPNSDEDLFIKKNNFVENNNEDLGEYD